MRHVAFGAVLFAWLVASGTPESPADERLRRGLVPVGVIELEGSVFQLSFDDAGRRMIVATVRYPAGELQRNELHLYELPASGLVVHRLTRDIADAAAVALSPDGEQIALGCGTGVCVHDWGASAIRAELVARGMRREIGALAIRPDAKLVVAAQRTRMELLTWDLDRDLHRSWVVAGVAERAREAVTPRLHGRPSWTPRWVGISPDATRVAAIRDDGTTFLWRRTGETIASAKLTSFADLEPAFAPDGTLLGLRVSINGRLAAVDVERDREVLSVEDGSGRSVRRAALLLGSRASYLGVSRSEGVVLHALPSGRTAAIVPVPDQVWRIAMNGQGRVVAVATQHRVMLWTLTDSPS